VVLRRRKDEVLTELPPVVLQDVPLDVSPGTVKFTSAAARALAALCDDAAMLKLLRNPDPAIAAVRRELGLLKVGPTLAWVRERLASSEKLLLFAWHLDVIERLRRGLLEFDPEVVTGASSPAARALAVQQFQENPGSRVFVGQILAAGTAITLTAASEVAIVEPSWVPGENVQAIARAHRLGQRDSVVASFLFLPGTLDQQIMSVFRRKAGEIGILLGDDNASAA
jgi:SWI/SNF-related matrix-associated actin-dependent regulator 1 of chromatin subfamily A